MDVKEAAEAQGSDVGAGDLLPPERCPIPSRGCGGSAYVCRRGSGQRRSSPSSAAVSGSAYVCRQCSGQCRPEFGDFVCFCDGGYELIDAAVIEE